MSKDNEDVREMLELWACTCGDSKFTDRESCRNAKPFGDTFIMVMGTRWVICGCRCHSGRGTRPTIWKSERES